MWQSGPSTPDSTRRLAAACSGAGFRWLNERAADKLESDAYGLEQAVVVVDVAEVPVPVMQ
jgi:hypothetical protein